MIEFTWKIESLEKNIADGGVVRANWRVNAVDGDYRSGRYGDISFTPNPDADDFIPFESLTEDVVLSWIFSEEGQDLDTPGWIDKDALEARLTADIEEQKTPVTTISGIGIGPAAENPLPWDTE
jgi:hypothetical protein